jgi:hypothetical protein
MCFEQQPLLPPTKQQQNQHFWLEFERSLVQNMARTWISWLRFLMVSSIPPNKCSVSTSNQAMTTSHHILCNSLLINNPTRQHYILQATSSVVKCALNKPLTITATMIIISLYYKQKNMKWTKEKCKIISI